MIGADRLGVLVAAAGAGWEPAALAALEVPDVVVLKRCVDVPDLIASASTGQAAVALVAEDLPGLDADTVVQLLRHDVRTVSVGGEDLGRLGVVAGVAPGDLDSLAEAVRAAGAAAVVADPEPEQPLEPDPDSGEPGRIVALWGPAGAPGRTTIAVALAARIAAADQPVVLADLDPYGGAIAQHLGILDEVSGVLAGARLANAGELTPTGYARCRRQVAPRWQVLTGLPRPDRWIEVRDGVTEQLLQQAALGAHVLADIGFCLEDDAADFGRGPGRNRMTLGALAVAEEVLVVGSADAVGLSRLARGLVELRDAAPGVPVRVVVNRMRDSLGWGEKEITGMVEGFVRPIGVHVLPEDRAACDRAMLAGTAVGPEGALGRALDELAEAVVPTGLRPRRAARGRWPYRRPSPRSSPADR